jgi:hypothetical protein
LSKWYCKQKNVLVLFAALSFHLEEEVNNPYRVAPMRPGGLLTQEELQEVRAGNWTCGTMRNHVLRMRNHVLRMVLPNTILAGNNIFSK